MEDQILEAYRALDKNEIENKENLKQHKQKDSRNLYLIKEGGKYYKFNIIKNIINIINIIYIYYIYIIIL